MKNDSKLDNYLAKQQLKEKRLVTAKRDNRLFPAIAGGALALAILSQLAYFGFGPGAASEEVAAEPEVTQSEVAEEPAEEIVNDEAVPDPAISENRVWQGGMNLNTDPIEFELYGDLAPQAVANFVALTNDGYFAIRPRPSPSSPPCLRASPCTTSVERSQLSHTCTRTFASVGASAKAPPKSSDNPRIPRPKSPISLSNSGVVASKRARAPG